LKSFLFAFRRAALLALAIISSTEFAAAEGCPGTEQPIATDRPDVTNSSLVIPTGSVQGENGAEFTEDDGVRTLQATNTRLRFGVADCTEILVDVPSYVMPSSKAAPLGFSDVSPAIKRQLEDLPVGVTASAVLGVALPTGRSAISGRGLSPYAQVPWSYELSEEWAVNGMETVTSVFNPGQRRTAGESSLSLERDLGVLSDAFIEYIADVGTDTVSVSRVNAGSAFRITPTEQIDFHFGTGLNQHSPRWFFGIGYSLRMDHLLPD